LPETSGSAAATDRCQLARELRADGFYERYPAKGQVERVARLHRGLARQAKIEPTKRAKAVEE
jgi:hypothetical protein